MLNIVIHCTAGYGNVQAIQNFWRNNLGWRSPGYHIIVDLDGNIHKIAPLTQIVNGVRGHNRDSLHISYIGGVRRDNVNIAQDTRTERQKQGIVMAIYYIMSELQTTDFRILGHRDFSPDSNGNGVIDPWERIKECPSFDAIPEYQNVISQYNQLNR